MFAMMLSDAASDAKPGSKLVSVCISTRSIFAGSAAWSGPATAARSHRQCGAIHAARDADRFTSWDRSGIRENDRSIGAHSSALRADALHAGLVRRFLRDDTAPVLASGRARLETMRRSPAPTSPEGHHGDAASEWRKPACRRLRRAWAQAGNRIDVGHLRIPGGAVGGVAPIFRRVVAVELL